MNRKFKRTRFIWNRNILQHVFTVNVMHHWWINELACIAVFGGTHLALLTGSWRWRRSRSRSWRGCCRRSCSPFPRRTSRREYKPWPASSPCRHEHLKQPTNTAQTEVKTLDSSQSVCIQRNYIQVFVLYRVDWGRFWTFPHELLYHFH